MGDQFVEDELALLNSFNEDDEEDNTKATLNAEADASSLEDLMSTPEGDTDDSQPEPEQSNNQEENTQTEEANTETKKAALLAKTFPKRKDQRGLSGKGEWDRKYEGKVDESGNAIIAPARPPEGGEKTKEIPVRAGGILNAPTGKMKKVTEAEYWDITYGDTHDPVTLLPIGLYELMLELER
jgi:hypothetical protein